MGHKKYRICLLMVAIAATLGGVLYYCFSLKEEEMKEKGTLVKQMQQTGEKVKEAGQNMKTDMANAFSDSGKTIKEAAGEVKEDMGEMTKAVKEDMKDLFSEIKEERQEKSMQTETSYVASGNRKAWDPDDK